MDRQCSRVLRSSLRWSSSQLHSLSVNAHVRASTESQNSEHFHCWRQTLPLRGVLFHPASEKETVRDVTEKRLLHRVFIATQSPNRLPQRRRLFVISQRNVCYIVFSSRHRAHVAEHARRCLVSPTLETTSPACFRFSTCGFSVRCPTSAVSMNSQSASRLSSSH